VKSSAALSLAHIRRFWLESIKTGDFNVRSSRHERWQTVEIIYSKAAWNQTPDPSG